MKTRKLTVILIMGILIMILPNSCKKNDNESFLPSPGPVIPETTKIISQTDWDENIISIDSTSWTLTFRPAVMENYSLAPGDVIISIGGQGLLRKVHEIKEEAGNVIVKTNEATLVDAMPTGRVAFDMDLTQNFKDAKILYIAEGVELKDGTGLKDNMIELVFSLEKELADNLTIAGELSIAPSVSGTISWTGGIPDTIIMQYNIEENLEITATVDILTLELDKEISLFKAELPTITIYVGIPVIITPVIELKLGAGVAVNCEMSTGVYQELGFEAGFEYIKGELDPFCDMDMDLGPIPPSLTNSLEAKAYVKPQIEMKIYQVISPSLAMELYALLEAEIGSSPWWTLYAGLAGEAGFKIGKWGFNILNINVNLFDYKVPVANADTPINIDPEACFAVEPLSGAIGQEFHFDASCCEDVEDPLEELEVRWDWEDDGIWDTDFTNLKETTHVFSAPGNHTIRMEVIDTDNGSDETTRLVQIESNHAPEAAFSVDPISGTTVTNFEFDASDSYDEEDPLEDLKVRWDWEGDGVFNTTYSYDKQETHQFETENNYTVVMEVLDTEGATSQAFQTVIVSNSGLGNPCPGIETVTYAGQTYNTVLVGDQCWLKENLNVGTRIDGSEDQEDNGVIEKYCYDDDNANCIEYGGLYQWNEIMQYVEYEGAQGICPPGWHIPTDDEWKVLEGTTDSQYPVGDPVWENIGWRGSDVSIKLRTRWGWNNNWNGTDDYGFSILPGGRRFTPQSYYSLGGIGYFWTSTMRTYDAYGRKFNGSAVGSYRFTNGLQYGHSVRCLKDE